MGRKSIAHERTQQILDAFESCIVTNGLDGATLQRVADKAAVKLSIINHYVGNREALVNMMVDRFITNYQQETADFLASLPSRNKLSELLDFYFSEIGVFYKPKDTIILTELMALSERDTAVKTKLLDLYKFFEDSFYQAVRQAVPNAADTACRQTAYLILALWVGHATLRWLGFDATHHQPARQSAHNQIETLSNKEKT